jgi:hypothetical protein
MLLSKLANDFDWGQYTFSSSSLACDLIYYFLIILFFSCAYIGSGISGSLFHRIEDIK